MSHAARTAKAVIIAVALASCTSTPVVETPPIMTTSAPPSSTPRSPTPSAVGAVRTTAAGALSSSVRLIELGRGSSPASRLWLVDLTGRRSPIVVAEWQSKTAIFRDISVSGDGRAVALTAPGPRSASALYVLRTETGELDLIFDEPEILAVEPRITPDGSKIAFSQLRASGTSSADLGIWLHDRASRAVRRIVEPQAGAGHSVASLGWSSDGAALAIYRSFGQPTVRLVPAAGGAETPVADGDTVSWRARAPQLLIGATLSGGQTVRIQTYDMATKSVREVHRVERSILRSLQWHPTADRFLYAQDEPGVIGRSPASEVWQRNADGSQAALIDRSTRGDMSPEWSPDGTVLTGFQAESSTTIGLIEIPGGRKLATLCRQGGTPPDRCT